MTATTQTGYDRIKALAKVQGVAIPDLLALSRSNDPFFAGSPASQRDAEWFAGVWDNFGFTAGAHLRRIHYRLVSNDEPVLLPGGDAYQNTIRHWQYLTQAAKQARYLGLVDATAFEDHRNPDPHLLVEPPPAWYDDEPDASVYVPEWLLSIPIEPIREVAFEFPAAEVSGYSYHAHNQPYHIELLVEKRVRLFFYDGGLPKINTL